MIEHTRYDHVNYIRLKRAAKAFDEAKEMLQSTFVIARLGQWVKKPLEQDSFEIPCQKTDVKIEKSDDLPTISPLGF